MTPLAWYDVIGLFGVALMIAAYALLQSGRLPAASPWFSALNGAGAALVLLSLAFEFNLAAFIVELFWLVISLYGLWRWSRRRRAGGVTPPAT